MILRIVSIASLMVGGLASQAWSTEPQHRINDPVAAQNQHLTPLSRPAVAREAPEQPNAIFRQIPPNSEALVRPDGPADILILPPVVKPAGQVVTLASPRDEKRVTVQCRYIYAGDTPIDGISLAMSVHPAGGSTSIAKNAISISDVGVSYDPATGRGDVIPLDVQLVLNNQNIPRGEEQTTFAVTCGTGWIDPRTSDIRDGNFLTENIVTVLRPYLAN